MGGAQMHAALRSGLIAEVDRVRDLWGLDADLQPSRCLLLMYWCCQHVCCLHGTACGWCACL